MSVYKPLLDQLRAHVEAHPLSEQAIAKAVGIDQANLNKFQAGRKGLSFDAIDKLCKYLNLRLVDPSKR